MALALEPALDAGVSEQVAAAQRGQAVLAGRRPRLEADGAGVPLLRLAGLEEGRGHWGRGWGHWGRGRGRSAWGQGHGNRLDLVTIRAELVFTT